MFGVRGRYPPGRTGRYNGAMAMGIRTAALTAAALAALWLAAGTAGANMRAPVSRHSPSAALAGPSAGLTVLGEELALACRGDGCAVRATYRLWARSAGSWDFGFVLPGPAKVTVRCGQTELQAASRPAHWPDPQAETSGPGDMPRLHFLPKMHQAGFELSLPAGKSAITVSYRQAWGKSERRFSGYFSGWLSARTLRYELWPLREWRLAPGFALMVTVKVEGDAGRSALLRAAAEPGQPPANLGLLDRDKDGALVLRRRWGQRFPARLELVVGTPEALATYGIKPPPAEKEPGPGLEQ